MSSTESAELSARAAQLIAFGLRPKLKPATNEEYGRLVAQYQSDRQFREVVDGVAAGFGIRILSANQMGFYLGAKSDSPFAYTLSDFRREKGMSAITGAAQRGLYGLVVVGIAAFFYPFAQRLVDERHPKGRVSEIDNFIRGACKELQARLGGQDPTVSESEGEPSWWTYLRERETSSGTDGRRGQKGTLIAVSKTLELFTDHGLVQKVRDEVDPIYQTLERFRLQVVRLAGDELFDALSELRNRERGIRGEMS